MSVFEHVAAASRQFVEREGHAPTRVRVSPADMASARALPAARFTAIAGLSVTRGLDWYEDSTIPDGQPVVEFVPEDMA